MSLSVVKTEKDERAEDVIKRLEEALEIARKTPQKAVSIVMFGQDGNIGSVGVYEDRIQLAGLLSNQLHDVFRIE